MVSLSLRNSCQLIFFSSLQSKGGVAAWLANFRKRIGAARPRSVQVKPLIINIVLLCIQGSHDCFLDQEHQLQFLEAM